MSKAVIHYLIESNSQFIYQQSNQYYIASMSQRSFKWKDISQISKKNNQVQTTKKELPQRFRPPRDRSESVDRIFNGSRSRIHSNSSIDNSQIKQTRIDEGILGERSIQKIRIQDDKEDEVSHLRKQVLRLNTMKLYEKQSSTTEAVKEAIKSHQLLTDIRKEFLHFKQNILQELQRQKKQINQMIKEIILTVEFELEKMGKKTISEESSNINSCNSTSIEGFETKTLEHWKNNLQNVDFNSSKKSSSVTYSLKEQPQLQPAPKPISKQETIRPPQRPFNFSSFIGGLQNLKKQVIDMDAIISAIDSQKIPSFTAEK